MLACQGLERRNEVHPVAGNHSDAIFLPTSQHGSPGIPRTPNLWLVSSSALRHVVVGDAPVTSSGRLQRNEPLILPVGSVRSRLEILSQGVPPPLPAGSAHSSTRSRQDLSPLAETVEELRSTGQYRFWSEYMIECLPEFVRGDYLNAQSGKATRVLGDRI